MPCVLPCPASGLRPALTLLLLSQSAHAAQLLRSSCQLASLGKVHRMPQPVGQAGRLQAAQLAGCRGRLGQAVQRLLFTSLSRHTVAGRVLQQEE